MTKLETRPRKRRTGDPRRSMELYRTLAQHFPNGAVLLFDHDLRYALADGAGLAEVGLSKELLEGKTIWEIFPSEICAILETHYRAALAGAADSFEMSFAGRVYLVRTLPIRDVRGDIAAGMAMTQDITAGKQAEADLQASDAELRALFAAMHDVILVLDREGRYVEIAPTNPSLLYKPADDLLGRTLHEVLPAWQANEFLGYIRRALETRLPVQAEYKLPIGGRDVWFAVAVSPMTHERVLWVARDITERVQARQLLEQRVEERTRELTTLLHVSRHLTSTLNLDSVLGQLLDHIRNVIAHEGASIFNLEGDMLQARAYRGPLPEAEVLQMRYSARNAFDQQIIATRQPLVFPDLHADTPTAAEFRRWVGPEFATVYADIRSWMRVPLTVKERVIGMLTLYHSEPDYFSPRQAELALAFADQAAVAMENARLFEAGRRRAEQFRVINEVGQRITSILDVDQLLNQTARLTRETFGYYHVHIGLIEDGEVVFKTLGAGPPDDPQFAQCESVRLKVGQEGLTGWVAASGEPVLVQDVSQDPRFVPAGNDPTRAELVLPIKVKGEVIGVLSIESDRPYAFDDSDMAVAQSLASQVAVAIENARLYVAEHRRADQFRAISEVGHHIISLLAVDELLLQTEKLIREIFGYYYISIGLVEGDDLIIKTDCPCDRPRLKVGEEGVMGWVAASGQPLLVPDTSQEPRHLPTISSTRTRSELALPIKLKDQIIGVLNVESDRLNDFDESDLAVLRLLANQLAVAIENARLYEQAGQLAALEERQKLARELHDSVSQALYGIALGARTARTLLDRDPSKLAEPLDYVLSLAEAGLAEMRALIFELRPESLEMEGLVAALEKQAASLRARHRFEVRTTLAGEPDAPLEVKQALYRIAQEALHNVAKHAKASRVDLMLQQTQDGLTLEVRDDGRGFEVTGSFPGHLGLQSMRERAERLGGAFVIESKPGEGCRLSVRVPLHGSVE